MRENNVEGVRLRRKHRTIIVVPANTVSTELRNRDFTATAPNITWRPVATRCCRSNVGRHGITQPLTGMQLAVVETR